MLCTCLSCGTIAQTPENIKAGEALNKQPFEQKGDVETPIDSGVFLLVLAGLIYGARKAYALERADGRK